MLEMQKGDIVSDLLIKKLKTNDRIGIVNRGEAALRFIRAVKEYNALHGTELKTVAYYIDKEEHAPFVKMADDRLALSSLSSYPGKQKSPYLDHDVMMEAISSSDCQAIWVGWGFVSEDAIFAERVEKAGVVFMGPSAKAMAELGDKITAKEIADKADVPILPWSRKSVENLAEAKKISLEIGYPVIVKASNAGGGRGIRFVRTPEELEPQFNSAKEETLRITGNDIVFIEALVEKGRHLEVQCLADGHGNVNTFGVRDCSAQRKNQKIIEETPPPHFDQEVITEMEAAAARLIKAAGYVGAGTVEYLYDLNRKQFFFMEVNTRLQVEHPITETLYGIDLVKGQIDAAMGNVVDLSDCEPKGWVMEVRLNAEDPDRDFSPAPGRVELFKAPAGPGIRIDSGIEQGSDIPSEFDSMVAKVIAAAPTRNEAIARLRRALQELRIKIENGTTNRSFLLELLHNPDVVKGGVHTGFVEELIKTRENVEETSRVELALMAGAVEMYRKESYEEFLNFQEQIHRIGRPRNALNADGHEVTISAQGNSYTFLVRYVGDDHYHLSIDGKELICQYQVVDQEAVLTVDCKSHNILMIPRGDTLQCEVDSYPVLLESESGGYVKSPSPAVVLSVNVQEEARVKKGDILIVLEAMKMEMLVEAPADGVVKEVCVIPGAQIAAGQALVQMEEEGTEKEEVSTAPRVDFPMVYDCYKTTWEGLKRNFNALFLGYDWEGDFVKSLTDLTAFARKHEDLQEDLVQTLIQSLGHYYKVEGLFINKEVEADTFSRPVTYQEMLSHYFRRSEDKEKGLPQEFLDSLEEMISCYPSVVEGVKSINTCLFHAFRSRKSPEAKHGAVIKVLETLESMDIDRAYHEELSKNIDQVIALTQTTAQNVTDAAIHTRYRVIDILKLEDLKQENYKTLQEMVEQVAKSKNLAPYISKLVDSSPYIMYDILGLFNQGDKQISQLALQVLAERQNRDRKILRSESLIHQDTYLHKVVSSYEGKEKATLSVFVTDKELTRKLPVQDWLDTADMGETAEVYLFVQGEGTRDSLDIFHSQVKTQPFKADWLAVGIFTTAKSHSFRTYRWESKLTEVALRRGFSPLQFRELRIMRLKNFNLDILYQNEGVFLLEATSKDNPKDIRLIGLADVSEIEPELNEDDDINRLVMFETHLLEAIYVMRAAQARYRYRLQWNRIIMYNRTLLGIRTKQLEMYGQKLTARTRDLGVEKLVVYTRRKRWSEEVIRELELNFLTVTQDQFNLRVRTPSTKPLDSLDKYVSKVVKSRQRNTVYPYEIIKMLTTSGFSGDKETLKGEFQEYDIQIKGDGTQDIVDVSQRPAGENESNIVFGVITNFDDTIEVPLKRVLILADPTRDLGSLSEPECRRVNAAIDLAESQQLPVEWIPISSGAKINMDSGTENLDWTAKTLKKIINFTQNGGEINIIVPGINVGAQSYWNAEATMLMHTRGLLIMTEEGSMLLTGKKALDFAGSVSGDTNLDIGGAEKIMAPNGQAQIKVPNLAAAYQVLFEHYRYTYVAPGDTFPRRRLTNDPVSRDITQTPYKDFLGQGFETIGDIFSLEKNGERKKPFDIRQVMKALIDSDSRYLERWRSMQDADTSIVWETQVGGYPVGMIGIESRNLSRVGSIPFDGPESWNGGTLFPQSSKKVARGINAFSGRLPLVIVANLSGFDGSPESLRRLQLEYGAEIGRAVVNFKGPIAFIVTARYHGGAYVVFSKALNPNLKAAAIQGSYASVLGGAPAAAVVFPRDVLKETYSDSRVIEMEEALNKGKCTQKEYDQLFAQVKNEKQTELGQRFDKIHSVERAKSVGSIDDIITAKQMRPYVVQVIEEGL